MTLSQNDYLFFQLYESETSTYTYVLADAKTREAIIIDPVFEMVDRDFKWLNENDLQLKYILDTHVHADHITGASELRKKTGAKTGVSARAHVEGVDLSLSEGDEIRFGSHVLRVLETPGHTNTCLSYVVGNRVFTGDALLIRGSGRTDFQEGSSETLFKSVREKLFKLPDHTIVCPGHDYRGFTSSTIGVEKKHNPRLGTQKTKEEFIQIMKNLKLANPRKIHESVPANLKGGVKDHSFPLIPDLVNGVPTLKPQQIQDRLSEFKLIDVRNPSEFNAELGHISGAKLVTLGSDLEEFLQSEPKDSRMIFICRSGGRSHEATSLSVKMGFKNTANLSGGMILWNELSYPVIRQ